MPKNNKALWVSQNFLTSKRIIHGLIAKTNITASDHIIEIGPGKGHITDILLEHCAKITAIELDHKLYSRLQLKYDGHSKLCLHYQDFMQFNLPASGEYKIFSNIPFSRTTDILRKLTECKNPPTQAWLIMEKGAARRFMGHPRESLRSLAIKPIFDMSIVHFFNRHDFHPIPGVDVVMLHMKRKPARDIPAGQMREFQAFVKNGLARNQAGLLSMFTKRQLSRACNIAGVSDLLSGEILYIQWLCLFRCYKNYRQNGR
ncbi:MAG: 23S ribosomal RNA methyltransferase Erm [Defluviitaleaceae bacterium]|nr:23S ribosomal RNA methyltransferase Erm [Defluviitaleaceae bacterium]